METKQNEKTQKRKGYLKAFVIASFLFLILIIIAVNFGESEQQDTGVQTSENTAQSENGEVHASADASERLIQYIYENTELGSYGDIKVEVTEFTKENCRTRVTIPSNASEVANIFGNGVCLLSVKWLSENDYDLKKIWVSSYVYSPYTGVTAREGMVVQWGNSYYNYDTDGLEWEWSKQK